MLVDSMKKPNQDWTFNRFITKAPDSVLAYAKNEKQKEALRELYRDSKILNDYYEQALNKDSNGNNRSKTYAKLDFERDIAYFKILMLFDPRLRNARAIIQHCTEESVESNKDNLVSYFRCFDTSVNTDNANNQSKTQYSINVALWAYYNITNNPDAVPAFAITRDFENNQVSSIAIHVSPYTSQDELLFLIKNDWNYIEEQMWDGVKDGETKRKKTLDSNVLQNVVLRFLIANDFSNTDIKEISEELFYSDKAIFPASRETITTDDCATYRYRVNKRSEHDWFHKAMADYREYANSSGSQEFDLAFDDEFVRFEIKPHAEN